MNRDFSQLTPLQREAFKRVRDYAARTVPQKAVKDLLCPDCGAVMTLELGAFGRYYRCSRRRCARKVSAKMDGSPPKKYYDPLRLKMSNIDRALGEDHGT